MSITITGGFTMAGGGFTLVGPPSEATAGWYGGGFSGPPYARTSTVARIIFATDTATPTTRGPLSATRYNLAGTGTLSYGWYGGGNTPTVLSSVDRITFASDTSTAAVRGPLSAGRYNFTATSDSTTYGWFIAGFDGGSILSVIDRITFATDTATASVRGPVSASVYNSASTTDSSTYGWFNYGRNSSSPARLSTVARITYATDTNSPTVRGPLSAIKLKIAATGTSAYGWYAGGTEPTGGSSISTVDRIDYSNDTATASVRGSLTAPQLNFAASTDGTTYGWFAGGGPSLFSSVSRITYANDTATASLRGPLTSSIYGISAAGDSTYGWFG
jgi:hypothetical protein